MFNLDQLRADIKSIILPRIHGVYNKGYDKGYTDGYMQAKKDTLELIKHRTPPGTIEIQFDNVNSTEKNA